MRIRRYKWKLAIGAKLRRQFPKHLNSATPKNSQLHKQLPPNALPTTSAAHLNTTQSWTKKHTRPVRATHHKIIHTPNKHPLPTPSSTSSPTLSFSPRLLLLEQHPLEKPPRQRPFRARRQSRRPQVARGLQTPGAGPETPALPARRHGRRPRVRAWLVVAGCGKQDDAWGQGRGY